MTTKDIVLIALFAALTAAMGLFPAFNIPMIGVPITVQTFGFMLAGALIGAKRGALAMLLFVLLLAVGFPLLSGGRGGLGIFLGPSGGYILAWPLVAGLIGLLYSKLKQPTPWQEFLIMVAGGIVLEYAIGIPWVAVAANLPLAKAALGSAAFIPGDIVKIVLAILIIRPVRRAFPGW